MFSSSLNYSSSVLNSEVRTIWNDHDNELISYFEQEKIFNNSTTKKQKATIVTEAYKRH
jgi:hypothetical protein